jgi:hypothetical protein
MVRIDLTITKYQESYYEKVVLTLFRLVLLLVVR